MNRVLMIFLLLCLYDTAISQCNCYNELKFLENKTEHNLPSYYDQVVAQKRENAYLEHKLDCDHIARSLTDSTECIYLLTKYLSFFRDTHLSLDYNESIYTWDENDADATQRFYAKEKVYTIPPLSKIKERPEGYWRTTDNKMIVRIVKHSSPLWDYTALVVKGNKKYWSSGQLKFSLKRTGKNKYECIFLNSNRKPRITTAELQDSVLLLGRLTEFRLIKDTAHLPPPVPDASLGTEPEFRELSSQTNYLRIPDFSYDLHSLIDSIVEASKGKIIAKPNLIIDVRENGGGSDRSYQALLPLVLTQKTYMDAIAASVFASDDVRSFYKENIYKYCTNRADTLSADSLITLLEQHKNKFTPVKFEDVTIDTVYTFPKKVAILIDRWCASSTEGFVLNIKQSSKVLLCGENTWGMCSYGELREVPLPGLPVVVYMPCKKMFMRDGGDYESIGIAPQVKLDPQKKGDWIQQVQARLEQ